MFVKGPLTEHSAVKRGGVAGGEAELLSRDQDTNDLVDHTESLDFILSVSTSQTFLAKDPFLLFNFYSISGQSNIFVKRSKINRKKTQNISQIFNYRLN